MRISRVVLVRECADGRRIDLVHTPMSVRSKAHEYGGGVYALLGERVFFVNASDQCIYETGIDGDPAQAPRRVTAPGARRFADLTPDPARQRLIAVCEDHAGENEPLTTLVAIDPQGGRVSTLAAGADFYSSPALDAAGRELAFLSWNHPDMPWDATVLWRATIAADGALDAPRRAGDADTSHFQPRFGPDGALYVVADSDGWWNLYRCDEAGLAALAPCRREFGFPQWVFGMATWSFVDPDTIAAISTADGTWSLHTLDVRTGALAEVPGFEYSVCDQLHAA